MTHTVPVNVLMDIGMLDKARYDDWHASGLQYTVNLHKPGSQWHNEDGVMASQVRNVALN